MKKFLVLTVMFISVFALVGCVTQSSTTQPSSVTTQSTDLGTGETSQVVTTDNNPVISGAEDITIEKNSTFVPVAGVTATDVEDGDLTSSINYSGDVNPMAVGEYTATYTVTDTDGNITTVSRTVSVVFTDTVAPLIVGTADLDIFVGQSFDLLEGVSASDTVDGSVTVTTEGTVDIWTEADYVITYTAEDAASNSVSTDRTVTVTYGDFVFGTSTDYTFVDLTNTEGTLSTPAFSGGVINETIADFTYIKVSVTLTSSAAGTVNLALSDLVGSKTSFDVTGTTESFEVIYVINEAVTDVTFDVDTNGVEVTDLNASVSFSEIRDTVAPTLNVPSDVSAYVVGYTENGLRDMLMEHVTAVDDVDGNVTDQITIDLGVLDLDVVGVYTVTYSVSDTEGNATTFEREVLLGNTVDSGAITDPTYQNAGDGQWEEKSTGGGDADIAYDSTEEIMTVTINALGTYPSAAGTFIKIDTANFETGQWYMFTFTAKTTIDRDMPFRMGLVTDQAHGWVDDFDGRGDSSVALTSEYQTFNFYFQLDTLISTAGYDLFIIELNLGMQTDWSNIGTGGVTTFKDMTIQKVVTAYEPPTFELNQSASLPQKLTVDAEAPVWADYVTFYNMSGEVVTATVDASAVDLTTAGTYDVVYTATDEHDETSTYTLSIEVVTAENADVTGPVVSLKPGVITSVDQFSTLVGNLSDAVQAIDAVDGDIAILASMIDDGGLNLDVAGVYTLTCTAFDLSGNVTVFTVELTVVDKEAPTIIINNTDLNVGDMYDPLDVLTVMDNVDGTMDNSTVTVTGLDAFLTDGLVTEVGTFTVDFTVADALGNQATKSITVIVSNIMWDEDTRTSLGAPDEGPTHSTANYDATEEATLITAIDPNTDSWDHARMVYYFDDTELIVGNTYKFEITVKADQATDLYFRVGSTLYVDPWLDNYTGGLKTVAITTEYVTYSIIFTVDNELVNGTAKFQFMYGYLASDATNTIYVKSFDLIQEKLPEYVTIKDMYSPGEVAHSTLSINESEAALQLSDMETAIYDWDTGRLVYYLDDTTLLQGHTYRIVFTAKADVATEIHLRIGSTLYSDPWIDNFDGGVKLVNVGTEYNTYELVFTVDKAMPYESAKFQFMYGYLGTDAGNSLYIKDFLLQELGPIYENVQDMYTPDETAHSTVTFDEENDYYHITDLVAPVYDWDTGRLVYYIDDTTLLADQTYRIVFTVKADVATDIHLRIGSTLYADPWVDNFEGGLKTVNVTTEYVTYELIFTVDKAMPYGSAKFQFSYGYNATDEGNALYIKDFYLQSVGTDAEPTVILVDDFSYADEAAFGLEWTERSYSVNTAADLSDLLDLDAFNNSMTYVIPSTTGGWTLARAFSPLADFGATTDSNYLAFYMTNNTDQTSASVWLYWEGGQNAFAVDLPAIGESGWVILDITASGKNATEITDFGLGFDNQAWSVCTGSLTYYKIVLVENLMTILDLEVSLPPQFDLVDNFLYADEAAFGAEWTERTYGVNTAADSSDLLDLDADNDAMVFTLPATTGGWTTARAFSPLTDFSTSDDNHILGIYVTNNTTATTGGVWLYWAGSQWVYNFDLPAAGESGWVFIDISDSGYLVSEILDFAIGFDNQPWSIVTGSLTIHKIVLIGDETDLERVPTN